MAIIQGLGYPEQNRSHFKSIALWETGGDGNRAGRNGWLTEDVEAMGSGFVPTASVSTAAWGSLHPPAVCGSRSVPAPPADAVGGNAGLGGTVSDSANPALSMLLDRGNALDSAMGQISAKIQQKGLGRHVNIDGGDLGRQAPAATLISAGVDTGAEDENRRF